MIERVRELLPGCWVLRLKLLQDRRGGFVKTFASSRFEALGLPLQWCEEYYSVSARHVLRGMHFQMPPHAHAKLVHCPAGSVRDVLLDLRRGDGYGRVATIELDSRQPVMLLVAPGVAHGFLALEEASMMAYRTSTEHVPAADAGVRWDSFGVDWGVHQPLLSDRDAAFPALNDFASPFGSP
jgi:dTDP-4-dehydrorhamnose 3,5-epimerase